MELAGVSEATTIAPAINARKACSRSHNTPPTTIAMPTSKIQRGSMPGSEVFY
jgi:hypothetical protein